MQVQTVSKSKDSKKTTKRELTSPKPPKKKKFPKGAGRGIPGSGVDILKKKVRSPKRKAATAVKVGLGAALVAGVATFATPANARAPDLTAAPLSGPVYKMPELAPASSVESISYLLHSMKAETDRYRKASKLDSYEVPLGGGAKLRLRMDIASKLLSFSVSEPGKGIRMFKIGFSDMGLSLPEVRIKDQGETLVVSLLDRMNGKHARFTFLKSDITPEKMLIRVFDESTDLLAAQYIFQSLNNVPEINLGEQTREAAIFMKALKKAEQALIRETQSIQFASASPEDKRKALERTVDSFISIYSELGGEAIDVISSEMESMPREQKKKLVEFALPRLTALLLRPFAAWQGSLSELDRLLSSPGFSGNGLREFAWHNNLHEEYNFLLRGLREQLSS